MQLPDTLVAEKRTLNLKDYKLRNAQEGDYERLITKSTLLQDAETGRVRIVYLQLEDDCSEVCKVLRTVKYSDPDKRTGGMLSQSRVFGYSPRIAIRNDYCHVTALSYENPQAHNLVASYASKVARYYQEFNPDLFAKHQQLVEKVLPDWKMEESIFTSGIINKNNPLPYHLDAGNFKEVWSNMLVFKHKVRGGYLSVPEYNVGFEVAHNSLLMFDGQNILHGVTPIYLQSDDAWRYSIVYYSLQAMWNCRTPGEEVTRIQKLRTLREEERLERQKTGERLDPDKKRNRQL